MQVTHESPPESPPGLVHASAHDEARVLTLRKLECDSGKILCDFCECDRKILNNERELEVTVREWRRKLEWKKARRKRLTAGGLTYAYWR